MEVGFCFAFIAEKAEKGFELELGSGKGEGKSRRIRKDLFLRVLQMGFG